MTFSSDFLAQLRAARGQTTPSAAPPEPVQVPAPAPVPSLPPRPAPRPPVPSSPPVQGPPAAPPRPQTRPVPDMAARAAERGRCGTCRHFTAAPDWGRLMGECSLGWAVHTPWAPGGPGPDAPPLPVMHAAARCMCHGVAPRWALRPGLKLAEAERGES